MTQNIALSKGSIAIEPFFDATQEMLSGAALNFRLVPISNTAIRAVAGTQDDQASISIDGSYRFRTTNVDAAHPGGAAGIFDVYVTGTPNDFTGPSPNIDLTDYKVEPDVLTSMPLSLPVPDRSCADGAGTMRSCTSRGSA